MRSMKKDTTTDTHIYFPSKVLLDVKKMAAANRRTVSAEIVLAMENKVREWKSEGNGPINGSGRKVKQ